MQDLYADYSKVQSAVEDMYVQCDRHICLGAYTSNMECMYTSAYGHIVDCSEFISGIYTDIVFLNVHMK